RKRHLSSASMSPTGWGGHTAPPASGSVKTLRNVVASVASALNRRRGRLDDGLRLRPERAHVLGDHDRGRGRGDGNDCKRDTVLGEVLAAIIGQQTCKDCWHRLFLPSWSSPTHGVHAWVSAL